MKIKPRIVIEPTGSEIRPFAFLVKWRGKHWKNSQWFTFDEALVAAGVKSLDSLPSASDLYQGYAIGGEVQPGVAYLVGEKTCESHIFRKLPC